MVDKVFEKPIEKQFEFDENVANVFDDMLSRSVPHYQNVIDLIIYFANKNLKNGDRVYDLGSSTGTTLIELSQRVNKDLDLIGVDNSNAMCKRAVSKSKAYKLDIEFINIDILDLDFLNSNMIISNYTFQFIRPIYRLELIKKVFKSLEDDGIFIFSEKLHIEDKVLNKQVIDKYYDFKKSKGYSQTEINQKREALENILIPYTQDENIALLKEAGFSSVDVIFRWLNFATFIAKK